MARKIILGILVLGFLVSLSFSKENFRFRLDYRLNYDTFSLAHFDSKDYSVLIKNVPADYFGNWLFFWCDTYGRRGGVLTKGFSHKEGDSVPLMQSREIILNETDNRLGIGLEFRLAGNLWLTLNYNKPGKMVINSFEQLDSMMFWLLLKDPYDYGGYEYYEMWLDRKFIVQTTAYELDSNNYQIGFSLSIISKREILFNCLAGFDFWSISQTAHIAKKTYSLRPWIGTIHGPITENSKVESEKKKLVRGFCGLELQIPVYKALKMSASAKHFIGNAETEFKNQFFLESPSGSWKIKIPKNYVSLSLSLSLIFGF